MAAKSTLLYLAVAGSALGILWLGEPGPHITSAAPVPGPARNAFQHQSLPTQVSKPGAAPSGTRSSPGASPAPSGNSLISQNDSGTAHDSETARIKDTKPASVGRPGIALPPPARLRGHGRFPLAGKLPEETHPMTNLTLDLGLGSVLPAVMAAPERTSEPDTEPTPAAAAAATLLDQFIESNAQPPTPPGDSDPVAAADQRWQDTVKQADERYRSLFGKEAFLRQSLQAARVLLEVAPTR